jgi:hypothetical protein
LTKNKQLRRVEDQLSTGLLSTGLDKWSSARILPPQPHPLKLSSYLAQGGSCSPSPDSNIGKGDDWIPPGFLASVHQCPPQAPHRPPSECRVFFPSRLKEARIASPTDPTQDIHQMSCARRFMCVIYRFDLLVRTGVVCVHCVYRVFVAF